MAVKVIHAGVVGASGLLGKELLEQLNDSAAAAWDLKLLEEGEEVEGQLASSGDEAVLMHALDAKAFAGLDLVFFAGTPAQTGQYLPDAIKAGAAVVDLSGTSRQEAAFLMRSPWVQTRQRPDLTTAGITVPQPAAEILALVTQRVEQKFGSAFLAATVLEPASEAGSAGVDELHRQTVSLLSFQDVPKDVYGTQVAFNLQGELGAEAQVSLVSRHQRLRQDLESLLGDNAAQIDVQLLQAPVFHSYVLSASLMTDRPLSSEEVAAALTGGVVQISEDAQPSNVAATESGELLLRVQPKQTASHRHWLLMAADNLRFTARSAIASALELVALRPGTRLQ